MNVNEKNTIFITIAAWADWESKLDVYLRSAKKQSIQVELLDKEIQWKGYFYHKIYLLRKRLLEWQTTRSDIRYVIFTDARDVVFIKPKQTILTLLGEVDEEKVLFALDNKLRTWPMNKIWLVQRITLRYGIDGIINSGCFAGRIDRIIELLTECVRIHENLVSAKIIPHTIEAMIYAELEDKYLDSDQFHFHIVQAKWSNLIDIDVNRRVFACFRDGFPLIKTAPELGSNGTMPIGTAGILHSPWMLHRDVQTEESIMLWKLWAVKEEIIDVDLSEFNPEQIIKHLTRQQRNIESQ
jgi:hypothetical protein